MEYWVILRIGEQPKGPFSLDEVVNLPLSGESVIWHKGIDQWRRATDFEELRFIFAEDEEERDGGESVERISQTEEIVAPLDEGTDTPQVNATDEPKVEEADASQAEVEKEVIGNTNIGAVVSMIEDPIEVEEKKSTAPATEDVREPIIPPIPNISPQQQSAFSTAIPPQPYPYNAITAQNAPECPPTYLVWNIIFTILCCVPFGVAGIVFSCLVRQRYTKGNYKGAQKASEIAMWMAILGFTFGLVFWPLTVFMI